MPSSSWKEFNKNELSHSAAHYLMAIHELYEKQGYARLIDVSKKLNISKGSLSISLRPLVQKKFIIEDENKHLHLSPKGLAFARHIEHTYEITKNFFLEILKVESKTAEIDACKIEHLLSGQTTHALGHLIKAIKNNPDLEKSLDKEMDKCRKEPCETLKSSRQTPQN